jgi:aromatic-amino-acid transaminase
MFSYTGLSPEQVKNLRDHHSVYMVSSAGPTWPGLMHASGSAGQAIADVCK